MPDTAALVADAKLITKSEDDSVSRYPLPVARGAETTPAYTDRSEQELSAADQSSHAHESEASLSHQDSPHPGITNAEELQLAAQLSQDLAQDVTSLLDGNGCEEEGHDLDTAAAAAAHAQRKGIASHDQRSDLQRRQQNGHQYLPRGEELQPHLGRPAQLEDPAIHREKPPQKAQERGQRRHDHYLPREQQREQVIHSHSHSQYLPREQVHQQAQLQVFLPASHQQPHGAPPSHPRPPPLQPHGALDQLAQHFASHPHAVHGEIPPRKRSKVSRACDECRRKKIRCDASSETADEPCSNCRRSAIRCLFSRIPQKRGPSKGYIKELADRIHSIEGKLANEGGNLDSLSELLGGGNRRESLDIFAPSTHADEPSRKRPFDSISGPEQHEPTPSHQAAWVPEPRSAQPHQAPPDGDSAPYSANGLAPHPLPKSPDAPLLAAAAVDATPIEPHYSGPIRQLDRDAFDVYSNVVHQCFPLLASDKTRIDALLVPCPVTLRNAFIEVLHSTMQSFISAPGLYTNGDIGSATRLIAEWESDSSPRNSLTNLVHLQTLVLTAIATDNHGPSSLRGEHGGPSKASVLGRAVGLAYSMRLHLASLESGVASDSDADRDSDKKMAIRTWWVLVMLDRWNAISTASPSFIPNDSVVLLPSLNALLGENVYHLIRLSNILGHFAPVSLAPPRALSLDPGARPILNTFFNLAIELFREVLPANITPGTHPLLHLVYWHCRLLSYLFQSSSRSMDVLWACKESVSLLLANTQLLSPLNHHFVCLVTLSLLELARVEMTREPASSLLKDLLQSDLAASTWDGVVRERITGQSRPTPAHSSLHLNQVVDMATEAKVGVNWTVHANGAEVPSRTAQDYADLGFDPSSILRGGYLNIIAGADPVSRGGQHGT
ncbi:hypothetical protein GGR57DRAFT_485736 [Xylariaceae sp. FL1272]|nr:hypothetical protein GGR57DRAFT_485736 [Xylariaceae sp. FL1272]